MTDHPTPTFMPGKGATPVRYPCPCGSALQWWPEQTHDVTRHLRNCMVFRADVSARWCPKADGSGSTHHLIPRRIGTLRNQTVYEHVCRDCGCKATQLRSDSAIEAAIHAIMEGDAR